MYYLIEVKNKYVNYLQIDMNQNFLNLPITCSTSSLIYPNYIDYKKEMFVKINKLQDENFIPIFDIDEDIGIGRKEYLYLNWKLITEKTNKRKINIGEKNIQKDNLNYNLITNEYLKNSTCCRLSTNKYIYMFSTIENDYNCIFQLGDQKLNLDELTDGLYLVKIKINENDNEYRLNFIKTQKIKKYPVEQIFQLKCLNHIL